MECTVSHAVCLHVHINQKVFAECQERKRNELWRGVGLAEGFLFCDSGFVTSLTNTYLSLVEQISVTDKRVTQ